MDDMLALFVTLVSVVTALLLVYWQRKQLKQIERYKQEGATDFGLTGSGVGTFLKTYAFVLVMVTLNAVLLVLDLRESGPITRWTIVDISSHVALILFAVVAQFLLSTTTLMAAILNNVVSSVSQSKAAPTSRS
jgi:hypothetical protein